MDFMPLHQEMPVQSSDPHSHAKRKLLAFAGIFITVSLPLTLLLVLRSEIVHPLPVGEAVERMELFSPRESRPIALGGAGGTKQAVLFVTVECGSCQRELLNMEVLYRRYRKEMNIVVVSLSDPTKTEEHVARKGFSLPVAYDEKGEAKRKFRVTTVPALFLIDEKGVLRYRRFGAASLQADEQRVLSLLKETQ